MRCCRRSTAWERGGKRAFDLVLASILLILLSPVLALCGVAVWLRDGAPIFFRQERVGRGGRRFHIVKFRTMHAASGPLLTATGDPRITTLGRWLRRTKLDELPQLWNVFRGEMSLVGPRPEVPSYVAREPRGFRAIAQLRPGITDLASLIFRDEEQVLAANAERTDFYARVLLPRKLALARLYAQCQSPRLDLLILWATACLVVGVERAVRRTIGERLYTRARHLREPHGQQCT